MKTLIKSFSLALIIFSFFLFNACEKNSSGPDDEHHHFEAIGLYVIQSGDTIVSYVGGTVTGEIEVNTGTITPLLYLKFLDDDGDIGVPEGDEYSLSYEIADTSIAQVIQHAGEDWELHISGKAEGHTTITFSILHDDHADFVSKTIDIHVEDGEGGYGEPEGLIVIHEQSGDTVAVYDEHDGLEAGSAITVQAGSETGHLSVQLFDHNGVYFTPDADHHSLNLSVANTSIAVAEIHDPATEPWAFEVDGIAEGSTEITIKIMHEDHVGFEAAPIPIEVNP